MCHHPPHPSSIYTCKIKTLLPSKPFLSFFGSSTGNIFAAMTGGHLETVFLAQYTVVKGLHIYVLGSQVDRMHGHWAGQQRFMGSRGTNPRINDVPERIYKHIKNNVHPLPPVFSVSLPPRVRIGTAICGNTQKSLKNGHAWHWPSVII